VQSAHDPGDSRSDTKPSDILDSVAQHPAGGTRSLDRYVKKAYRNEQRSPSGRLARTEREFLLSVEAQLLLELGGGQQQLREFEERIEDAMAEDRRLRAAGRKATMFRDLPERRKLMGAIRRVIAEDRPPRRKLEQSVPDMGMYCDASSNHCPVTHAVMAEEAGKLYKALDRLDQRDQDILRSCYYDGQKQVEAARSLSMPPQTINRRLQRALATLADDLRQDGIGD
jgi:RNA polymerase sigma factor (sigma-70 family)